MPMSNRASTAWSHEDDQLLLLERRKSVGWGQIQQKYFPNKTANACRKRHERLIKSKKADEWEGDKLGQLATAYEHVRKDMWTHLANQVGAQWDVVEKVCYETGLSRIRTAASNYQKKQHEPQHVPSSARLPSSAAHPPTLNQLSVPQDLSVPHGYRDSGIGIGIDPFTSEDMLTATALAQVHAHSQSHHSHPHYHAQPR
ncbi:MAG: hypothetical protein M1823_005863 [Watsoniomyces obsoletus]|nr:MAG: hypothetical protein M1823_005863 [Watsoniomyces obsoletus]